MHRSDALFLMTRSKVKYFFSINVFEHILTPSLVLKAPPLSSHYPFFLSYLFSVLINYFDNFYKWFTFDRYARLLHWSEDPLQRNWEKYRNVKITGNWKDTFTKRLVTFLTVEKCGKLLLKFAKNSFTSTNFKGNFPYFFTIKKVNNLFVKVYF